mgnify:CR=1 FL=1
MSLKKNVAALEALIAATPFVAATSLSYEERPPTAGLIKGAIVFTDGSQLDFKEFLITQPTAIVFKYAYNYRLENHLLFRDDNASDPAARNLLTYPSHKHVSSGISDAEKPSLEQVREPILTSCAFMLSYLYHILF